MRTFTAAGAIETPQPPKLLDRLPHTTRFRDFSQKTNKSYL
ncbi:hypothetical protein CKA32_005875 [Geitlerinema sp. FC II]|nr:hypothetical protein CKA32_005875 [Geitlerinema sp. FC II]